jgi:hypothetical protein
MEKTAPSAYRRYRVSFVGPVRGSHAEVGCCASCRPAACADSLFSAVPRLTVDRREAATRIY